MAKHGRTWLALLLSLALLLTGYPVLLAGANTNTQITGVSLARSDAYSLVELWMDTNAVFTQTYDNLQSEENATGEPSAELLASVANNLVINGESIAQINEGLAWYGGVQVFIDENPTTHNARFYLQMHDAAFGGADVSATDFSVGFTDGAVDSAGNAIEPVTWYYSAATKQFSTTPPEPSEPTDPTDPPPAADTQITGVSASYSEQYALTEVWLNTNVPFTRGYSELQSAENATGEPSAELLGSVANNILVNGKRVPEIIGDLPWYGSLRVYIEQDPNTGNERFYLMAYDAAFGGSLLSSDFNIAFTEGAIDGAGNAIEPVTWYYSAATGKFSTTPPAGSLEPTSETHVSLMMESPELQGGWYFGFDSPVDYTDDKGVSYDDLMYSSNTDSCWRPRIDTAYFRKAIEQDLTITIGDKTDTPAGWNAAYNEETGKGNLFAVLFGRVNGKNSLFFYYKGEGAYAPDQVDITVTFREGFCLPDGEGLLETASFTRSAHAKAEAETSSPDWWTSAAGGEEEQVPLSETNVTFLKEVNEARGGWYFVFDSTVNYDDGNGIYQDLVYSNNTELCWRERIDTPYFRNSIEKYLTVTIGDETKTIAEWNSQYQAYLREEYPDDTPQNLLGVFFGAIDENPNTIFLYYWGKGDYLAPKNVITVNFLKGFCLPDGEGLLETASFTRSNHRVADGVDPEWWSDDGSTIDYGDYEEIRPEDIIRDEKGDMPIDVIFSTETMEGTGMIYFELVTAANFGQDDSNVFNGLQFTNNDTVWRPAIATPEFKDSILTKLIIKVGDDERPIEEWENKWHLCLFRTTGNWQLTMHYNGEDKDTYDWWNEDVEVAFLEGFTLPTGDVINPMRFKREGGATPASPGVEERWSIIEGFPGPESMLAKITSASLSPQKGQTKLELPVTEGYKYEIVRTKKPEIIDLEGNITPPAKSTYVTLTLEVTRLSDGLSALGRVSVLVPGTGAEETEEPTDPTNPDRLPGDEENPGENEEPGDDTIPDTGVTGALPAAAAALLASGGLLAASRKKRESR